MNFYSFLCKALPTSTDPHCEAAVKFWQRGLRRAQFQVQSCSCEGDLLVVRIEIVRTVPAIRALVYSYDFYWLLVGVNYVAALWRTGKQVPMSSSSKDNEILQVLATCAWALARAIELMDCCGLLLSNAEASETWARVNGWLVCLCARPSPPLENQLEPLRKCRRCFLRIYAALST